MGGEGATSPWPKLIVVFETNLLEGCCKLGAFKVKVFLAENFVSSCCWLDGFLNICKLDGCCKEEAFKLELMTRLEGCSCAVAALVVVVVGTEAVVPMVVSGVRRGRVVARVDGTGNLPAPPTVADAAAVGAALSSLLFFSALPPW